MFIIPLGVSWGTIVKCPNTHLAKPERVRMDSVCEKDWGLWIRLVHRHQTTHERLSSTPLMMVNDAGSPRSAIQCNNRDEGIDTLIRFNDTIIT